MPLGALPFPTPGWRDLLEILSSRTSSTRCSASSSARAPSRSCFGLLVLAVIYLVAFLLKLSMITYLLGVVFTYGVFAALVVFQPELRQALARLGQIPRLPRCSAAAAGAGVAEEIAQAVERLSRSATGAIIAVERDVRLDEYLESGTPMRATVSADLLATIFSPYSPLHDGAVLVRGDEIVGAAASCRSRRIPSATAPSAHGIAPPSDSRRRPTRWSWSCRRRPPTSPSPAGGALQRGLTTEQVSALLAGRGRGRGRARA